MMKELITIVIYFVRGGLKLTVRAINYFIDFFLKFLKNETMWKVER